MYWNKGTWDDNSRCDTNFKTVFHDKLPFFGNKITIFFKRVRLDQVNDFAHVGRQESCISLSKKWKLKNI